MMKPCAGDWVEVRSKAEILATLDQNGRLDGLPFMPQMFKYCGKRFQVYKRAHKTCDTVSGCYSSRTIPDAVHLEHRCDGKAYGGCQAECLIVWKEAWLKPVDDNVRAEGSAIDLAEAKGGLFANPGRTVDAVIAGTRAPAAHGAGEPQYVCQATELLNYSQPLKRWDARQFIEDYQSKNASLGQIISVLFYAGYSKFTRADRYAASRWLYDRFQALRGGVPHPRRKGTLRPGKPIPDADINLQPGELVRVKSFEQILATIGAQNRHRGLSFDVEMVPYCGQTFRVRARVDHFVDEQTGFMRRLKTPAVILEGVTCGGRYSNKRWLCPRSIFPWWREIWLERAPDMTVVSPPIAGSTADRHADAAAAVETC